MLQESEAYAQIMGMREGLVLQVKLLCAIISRSLIKSGELYGTKVAHKDVDQPFLDTYFAKRLQEIEISLAILCLAKIVVDVGQKGITYADEQAAEDCGG